MNTRCFRFLLLPLALATSALGQVLTGEAHVPAGKPGSPAVHGPQLCAKPLELPPAQHDGKLALAPAEPGRQAPPAPRGELAAALGATPPARPSDERLMELRAALVQGVRFDAALPGELWVRGESYKARVDAEGLEYTPFLGSRAERNWPLGLRMVSAHVGPRELALAAATPVQRSDEDVVIDRGALREVFRFAATSVEHTIEIDALPERGALRLAFEVESDLTLRSEGGGLCWEGPEGGVAYGSMTVFDARGRSLAAPSRWTGERLELEVDAAFVAAAELPLLIDPLLTTLWVNVGPVDCANVDVAYEPTQDVFLVTWEEVFSVVDYDVNSMRVTPDGVPLSTAYVDVTVNHWNYHRVAANARAGTFLVVAQRDYWNVWGRIVPSNGTAPLNQVPIATDGDGFPKAFPDVGGDVTLAPPTYFLCAYTRRFSVSDTDIHANLIDPFTGALLGSTILIDNSANTLDDQVRVSRTNGKAPYPTQRWNVTFARGPTTGATVPDLYAAQLSWNGDVVTPTFNLTSDPGVNEVHWADSRAVSEPLDDLSGQEREWAAAYARSTGNTYPGTLKLLRGSVPHDTKLLSALTGTTKASYEFALEGDGQVLALAINHLSETGLYTLRTEGHAFSPSEGPLGAEMSSELTRHSSMALQQSHSSAGPFALAVFQEGPDSETGDVFGAVYRTRDQKLGDVPCTSNPNSSGFMAFLSAIGSSKVSDNRLTFEVENLPPFQNGIFVFSRTGASIPLGQGVLCMGSPVYRMADQIMNSGAGGFVVRSVNLNAMPAGQVVQPGDTWHFQYWTRDGANMNFSNGVRVQFQ